MLIVARNKHQAIVGYFLRESPSQEKGTNNRGVIIDLAAQSGWKNLVCKHNECTPKGDFRKATEVLSQVGTDINETDVHGKTALDHALARNLGEIVPVLRADGES